MFTYGRECRPTIHQSVNQSITQFIQFPEETRRHGEEAAKVVLVKHSTPLLWR